jgi:fumarate reductase iron-sulfur subunit
MADQGAHRKLTLDILRYNPREPATPPRMQRYELEEADSMTLFIALNEIREKQDPSLQFDFVCRAGICGSCGMMINGRPGLACRTLTEQVGPEITLAPLPVFELIGDLSVNTGKWMRHMSERLATWVHMKSGDVDLTRIEEVMDPALAVGLNRLARFRLDPRDTRDDAAYYELIGDDTGVFGCMSLLACHDLCPKDLPLQTQIAFLRRKMVIRALK